MNQKRLILYAFLMVCLAAGACSPLTQAAPLLVSTSTSPAVAATSTPQPSQTATLPPPTGTPTETPTVLPTGTNTPTPSPSPVPTYALLRGEVLPDKVSCRYGPGPMYLYLYGMVKGAVQDVIGRTDTGKWLLTKSHGDDKSCWVKAEFLKLNGDVMSLEMVYPDKFTLIQSNQGYRKPWNVAAVRKGDDVVITWESEPMRAGDEESPTSVQYVVETWVCQGGQIVFTPLGTYTAMATVKDEKGCAEPSHGRVYFMEKHGYTGPTEISWPAYP